MVLKRFWWDTLSYLYVYAAVMSLMLIPLWFTAGWSDYQNDDEYVGTNTIRLQSSIGYTTVAIVLFVAVAAVLLYPVIRGTVHTFRHLVFTKLVSGFVLVMLLFLNAAMADEVASTDGLSNFSVSVGMILMIVVALALFVLQFIITAKSKQYKIGTQKSKTVSGRAKRTAAAK